MRIFGLTGGIASGKSQVARHFRRRVPVIDADELARDVVQPGKPALGEIVTEFGQGVLAPNGELDRKALGALVFSDQGARRKLNALVHPRVAELLRERLAELSLSAHSIACYEVPLLFEGRLQDGLRPVVLVAARPELQIARMMKRDGLTEQAAKARIAAQMPLTEKEELADYVIDNNGSLEETLRRADEVLDQVLTDLKAKPAT